MSKSFSITPEPRILEVLGAIPLRPVSALCELIDNALDSFEAAELAAIEIPLRRIDIRVPSKEDVERGRGVVSVVDNGYGMDLEQLQNSLVAGMSGKDNFDQLGLYGVGFNLATVKLGPVATITTARRDRRGNPPESALRTVLDVPAQMAKRSWELEFDDRVPNPQGGTVIEVSGLWPEGHQNHGFMMKLARMSKNDIARQLGRIYATKLRQSGGSSRLRLTVNDNVVEPFEHCVWSERRSVHHRGIGEIPARLEFNTLLRTTRRCKRDGTEIAEREKVCSKCGAREIKSVEQRVRGWVGIQRYDHMSDFGIDIIRNGRLILNSEKELFFSYTDEEGKRVPEYPADSVYGRIVGELHLDHVRPNANKEDFERATREWTEAIEEVRGGPLWKSHRPSNDSNLSPLGRMFNGYRDSKYGGPEYMYMGTYREPPAKPAKMSAEQVAEYKKKFDRGEEGYVDDTKWWEQVENAVRPPNRRLTPCPKCQCENPEGTIECSGCEYPLIAKTCNNNECAKRIAQNVNKCPYCEAEQDKIQEGPWKCQSCSKLNNEEHESCVQCDLPRGLANPMSVDELKKVAAPIPELSFEQRTFPNVDGSPTTPITISVFSVEAGRLKPHFAKHPLPTFCPSGGQLDRRDIFIDTKHSMFTELGYSLEYAVASQVALLLVERLSDKSEGRSALNLSQLVLASAFGEKISLNEQSVQREVEAIFERITNAVADTAWSKLLGVDIPTEEENLLGEKLFNSGRVKDIERLKESGGFLAFVPQAVSRLYRSSPEHWESEIFVDLTQSLPEQVRRKAVSLNRRRRLRALEECADFLSTPMRDYLILRQVKAQVTYLDTEIR